MNYSNPPKFSAEIIQRIHEENERIKRVTALRIQLQERKELCGLALAAALLRLNITLGLTWEDIASLVDGLSDKGHAHRLAKRTSNPSKRVYRLATESINQLLSKHNHKLIDFPQYPEGY